MDTEHTTEVADNIKDVVRSVLPSAGSISQTMPWILTRLLYLFRIGVIIKYSTAVITTEENKLSYARLGSVFHS
jgi:hypothetical protein